MSNNIFFERGQMADKPNNYLWNGDCLELMKDIPDKSMDAIICDLPYGTTACKWDSVIPFEPLWKQYKRIIKDNGAIVLFGSQPFTSALISSNYDLFKYEIVWDKVHGANFFNLKYQPFKTHENIIVFGKNITYNPIREPRTKSSLKRYNKGIKKKTPKGNPEHYGVEIDNNYELKDDKHPSSIIKISSKSEKRNGIKHPTKKPLELIKYLVKTYTNENDWVLDNTCGSNTTGIACYDLNRNYIGIEKDVDIYNVAKKRMEKNILLRANEQQTLFKDES